MKTIIENLKALGRTRLAIMAGVGLAIVVAMFFGISAMTAPTYQALFTGLSPSSASRIVSTLEQAGFQPQVSADSAVVRVREADLARARMAVAEAGLAQEGAPGYELFDETSGLGMNSFAQNITRIRAMEGELARSIQTLDTVDSARVHLVLPEREAFSREAPTPTASVVVRTRSGGDMTRSQAVAVRSLVAAAVPDLDPGNVTVVSATGRVILAEDGGDAVDTGLGSRETRIEDRMARNIESLLSARVGAGNVRVEVNADLSNERRVTVEESYDPDQQVERVIETLEEQEQDQDLGADQVGVQGNIPEGLGGEEAGGGTSESSLRTRERTEFEIGSVRSETIVEPGDVERVSVAVFVNGIYQEGPNGQSEYQERSASELTRLETLVKSAVGFNEARGDTVSIDSMRFMDYSMALGEQQGPTLSGMLAENMDYILRLAFALILVGLILAFLVRPVLNRIFPAPEDNLALAGGGTAALSGGDGAAMPALGADTPGDAAEGASSDLREVATTEADLIEVSDAEGSVDQREYVRINAVQGLITRHQLEAVRKATDADIPGAASVIRSWANAGA